jgi:hypothetical protein
LGQDRIGGEPHYEATHPELFRRACELLVMEQPRDRVEMLIDREAPNGLDARALLRQAWDFTRGERRDEGKAEVLRGALMLGGGLLASIAAFTVLTGLGAPFYVIFTGLIGYGGYLIVSGLKKLSS